MRANGGRSERRNVVRYSNDSADVLLQQRLLAQCNVPVFGSDGAALGDVQNDTDVIVGRLSQSPSQDSASGAEQNGHQAKKHKYNQHANQPMRRGVGMGMGVGSRRYTGTGLDLSIPASQDDADLIDYDDDVEDEDDRDDFDNNRNNHNYAHQTVNNEQQAVDNEHRNIDADQIITVDISADATITDVRSPEHHQHHHHHHHQQQQQPNNAHVHFAIPSQPAVYRRETNAAPSNLFATQRLGPRQNRSRSLVATSLSASNKRTRGSMHSSSSSFPDPGIHSQSLRSRAGTKARARSSRRRVGVEGGSQLSLSRARSIALQEAYSQRLHRNDHDDDAEEEDYDYVVHDSCREVRGERHVGGSLIESLANLTQQIDSQQACSRKYRTSATQSQSRRTKTRSTSQQQQHRMSQQRQTISQSQTQSQVEPQEIPASPSSDGDGNRKQRRTRRRIDDDGPELTIADRLRLDERRLEESQSERWKAEEDQVHDIVEFLSSPESQNGKDSFDNVVHEQHVEIHAQPAASVSVSTNRRVASQQAWAVQANATTHFMPKPIRQHPTNNTASQVVPAEEESGRAGWLAKMDVEASQSAVKEEGSSTGDNYAVPSTPQFNHLQQYLVDSGSSVKGVSSATHKKRTRRKGSSRPRTLVAGSRSKAFSKLASSKLARALLSARGRVSNQLFHHATAVRQSQSNVAAEIDDLLGQRTGYVDLLVTSARLEMNVYVLEGVLENSSNHTHAKTILPQGTNIQAFVHPPQAPETGGNKAGGDGASNDGIGDVLCSLGHLEGVRTVTNLCNTRIRVFEPFVWHGSVLVASSIVRVLATCVPAPACTVLLNTTPSLELQEHTNTHHRSNISAPQSNDNNTVSQGVNEMSIARASRSANLKGTWEQWFKPDPTGSNISNMWTINWQAQQASSASISALTVGGACAELSKLNGYIVRVLPRSGPEHTPAAQTLVLVRCQSSISHDENREGDSKSSTYCQISVSPSVFMRCVVGSLGWNKLMRGDILLTFSGLRVVSHAFVSGRSNGYIGNDIPETAGSGYAGSEGPVLATENPNVNGARWPMLDARAGFPVLEAGQGFSVTITPTDTIHSNVSAAIGVPVPAIGAVFANVAVPDRADVVLKSLTTQLCGLQGWKRITCMVEIVAMHCPSPSIRSVSLPEINGSLIPTHDLVLFITDASCSRVHPEAVTGAATTCCYGVSVSDTGLAKGLVTTFSNKVRQVQTSIANGVSVPLRAQSVWALFTDVLVSCTGNNNSNSNSNNNNNNNIKSINLVADSLTSVEEIVWMEAGTSVASTCYGPNHHAMFLESGVVSINATQLICQDQSTDQTLVTRQNNTTPIAVVMKRYCEASGLGKLLANTCGPNQVMLYTQMLESDSSTKHPPLPLIELCRVVGTVVAPLSKGNIVTRVPSECYVKCHKDGQVVCVSRAPPSATTRMGMDVYWLCAVLLYNSDVLVEFVTAFGGAV